MNAVLQAPAEPLYSWLTPGLHFDVPADEYHDSALRPIVTSKGGLDQVDRSLAHWYAYAHGEADKPDSRALKVGRALHTLILEPEKFDSEFAVPPQDAPRRPSVTQINAAKPSPSTKDAIAFWAQWDAVNAGRVILPTDELDRLHAMQASIHRHPIASKIIRDGNAEVTSVWLDDSGLLVKNRLDYLVSYSGYALDLKSCLDASPRGFARAITNFRYHVQDALYDEGLKRNGFKVKAFCFLACEKEPPYAPAIYLIDAAAETRGWELARRNLDDLARAIDTHHFPAYSGRIETLSLPKWAFDD